MTERCMVLKDAIDGVEHEIRKRYQVVYNMHQWLKDPYSGTSTYSMDYVLSNLERKERKLKKLRLIKIELIYLVGLEEYL